MAVCKFNRIFSAMENFELEAGKFTPEIVLDAETGDFLFRGECFPSSRRNFFVPIYDWIKAYLYECFPKKIHINFELTFLDTASTQSFLRILQLLDDYKYGQEEEIKIQIDWKYEEDDLDMLGVGEDYQEDVKLEIELIPIPPRDLSDFP